MVLTVAGLLYAPQLALAQDAIQAPASKAIGTPSSTKPEMVPSLIVMNARGASLQGDTLTLNGVPPNFIIFADRPVRAAGHMLTTHLIEDWDQGSDSFGKEPPNATVSVFSKDGSSVKDAVVVLKSPKLDGDKLTFAVQVLEGDLTGAEGAASVFIDLFGVRRRAFRRGAYYGAAVGAAAVGAAAVGAVAAPYVAPYAAAPYAAAAYYGRPACGYYPYPPCY
ncbi:MAG: hypothetical protein WA884_14285 [Methyloceanibacter sp.]